MKNWDVWVVAGVALIFIMALGFCGCAPKTHVLHLTYGEKAVISVPSNEKGKIVYLEVEAPEWEDVK